MANGEVKYILNTEGQPTGRISIQVDHIAHVFDLPAGMKAEDAIAQFWKRYENFKTYERRIIASNNAKRRAEAAAARKAAIAGVAAMPDAQIEELIDKKAPVTLTFEGLEVDDDMVAALTTKPKPVGAEKKAAEPKPPVAA